MFEGFQEEKDAQAKKRWAASAGTSLGIYLVIGVALAFAAGKTVEHVREDEESIDVTFEDEPPEPEAEKKPPPPPPPDVAPVKAKKAGKKPLVQPVAIPDQRPAEAAGQQVASTEDYEEEGDGGDALNVKPEPKPEPKKPEPEPVVVEEPKRPEPVEVEEDYTPASRLSGGAAPQYPDDARAKGIEAEVIIKISVSDTGQVTVVKVLRGDEPFLSAALDALKTWRYSPALVDGQPTACVKIVKIPFRIRS